MAVETQGFFQEAQNKISECILQEARAEEET